MRKLAVAIALVAALLGAYAIFRTDDTQSFCKMRFGATNPIEAVFVCGNDSLLVYRDGDLTTEPEKYSMRDGKLTEGTSIPPFDSASKTYAVTQCYEHIESEPSPRHSLMVHVTISDGETQFKQYCDVGVSPNRQQLDHAHFDGPLSVVPQAVDWVPIKKSLVIGGEPTDLRVVIGTFNKPNGCWTVVESGSNKKYNFPTGVYPVATIEFPTENPDSPIVKQFILDQFC